MNTVDECLDRMGCNKDFLVSSVIRTADWRERKAEEYPDDDRNAKAAIDLRRMAKQLAQLPDSHPLLARLEAGMRIGIEEDAVDETASAGEGVDELLRTWDFSGLGGSDVLSFLERVRDIYDDERLVPPGPQLVR